MRRIVNKFLLFCLFPGAAFGQFVCVSYGDVKTHQGILERQECKEPNRPGPTISKYVLDGKVLISGPSPITFENENKGKNLFALQGSYDPSLYCPNRMFLIDLTGEKPRVFAFGVKNACAEYHWASWGKKRSVIAIKENIRFTYSNGKLSPPPDDFGDGTPLSRRYPEDGKPPRVSPFVEELPVK
jgi:hypothetical protein